MDKQLLIGPFTQLITMDGLPLKGSLRDDQLTIIPDGGVLINGEIIEAVGSYNSLLKKGIELARIEGQQVCLPGLIDAHTHICFAGSRARDHALRNAGSSYLDIAKAGGGIWDTVSQTRKATEEELLEGILQRSHKHLQNGVTTLEVKSGYGLSINEELKMLRAIQKANQHLTQDLISTCLAAHIVPKDTDRSAAEYLEEIATSLFPKLRAEKLTNRIDAFVEESAFSKKEIIPYLERAKAMGFALTIHADQFSPGGSEIAVRLGALSADHLEASTAKEIEVLAKSNTIAMALPGASIGLGCDFTPARKLLDGGASLAIASDHNPGSAPMGDLLTQASILANYEKLSHAEVLAGITHRAAAALGLQDRGVLTKGNLADFAVFPVNDYREILYHQGQIEPKSVWKKGVKQFDRKML